MDIVDRKLNKIGPWAGIYKITNRKTGWIYIGQSKNTEARVAHHKELLLKGRHPTTKMQQDFKQQGSRSLSFSLISRCDERELLSREDEIISDHRRRGIPLYNTARGPLILRTEGIPQSAIDCQKILNRDFKKQKTFYAKVKALAAYLGVSEAYIYMIAKGGDCGKRMAWRLSKLLKRSIPKRAHDKNRLYTPMNSKKEIQYIKKYLTLAERREILLAAASHKDFD